MSMKKRLSAFLVAMLAGSMPALSWAAAGTEGASFLDIPVGGAPAALGSAYTAQASDAYAPVWNPAGLGFVDVPQMAAMHSNYIESLHYEFASFALPFDGSKGLAASIQYLGSGDIDVRDNAGNLTGGTFNATFAAYSLAYGQKLNDKLAVGITGKAITENISDASAKAYAADAGVLYKPSERLSIGSVLANAGTPIKFVNQSDSLPLALRLGGTYKIIPELEASLEGVYRRDGLVSAQMGLEWKYADLLSLRGGYNTSRTNGLGASAGLSAGAGLFLYGQEIDYAWVPFGDLGSIQYISLVLRFSTKAPPNRPVMQRAEATSSEKDFSTNDASDSEYHDLNDMLNDSEKKSLQQHSAPEKTSDGE